jgi:transposase InsO family protein
MLSPIDFEQQQKLKLQGVQETRGYLLLDGEYRSQKTGTKPVQDQCVIGLFKTEVINQIGPWKSMREVEWETLKWVDWYNNRRLLGPIGYIPPAEAEEAFYANLNTLDMVA